MTLARLRLCCLPTAFVLLVLLSGGHATTVAAPQSAATAALGASSAEKTFAGFDELVAAVMREWKIPGLAVAAIKDGSVVLSKGYGYRDVERQLPVTPQTLMAIGSNSKSFTVTLMGMLSDEGKLDWDKPVRTYLPDFELHDDVASRLMTPTDLVTHRSGLPRHDLMWYGRAFTRKELYQRLRFLEPSVSFRQRYQYNNLMFMTAGYLVEQLTQQSWDDLIRQRIFTPLGMTRSNTSVRHLPSSGDYALPYMLRDEKVVPVAFRNIDVVAPAGSINSSVEDMARYIQLHIQQGTHNGAALVSKRFATRMQSPHSALPIAADPEAPVYAELGPGAYGLGVNVASYRGHKQVTHGGGIDGFISSMSWMPDEKLGVIVLSNYSGINPVPTIVMQHVYDRLLGLEPVDWAGRVRTDQARVTKRQREREAAREAERVTGTSPSHALADFAGQYEHPGYGVVTVTQDGVNLSLRLDQLIVPLEHFHYDVFRPAKGPAVPGGFEAVRVTFGYGANGKVERVTIPLEPGLPEPLVFTRKRDSVTSTGGQQ